MLRALLLSPDDQAVNAITGVLEEMSVSWERPLDGASAAQKLHAHNFDLVLVDCENLPAAKLIFDVCRRGKSGSNPVPIAIVDGRAGLPTAFRLGAELILTKPVAKDQARSTIRTGVGRVRKEEPPRTATADTSIASAFAAPLEARAQAAAAAATPMAATTAPALGSAPLARTSERIPASDDELLPVPKMSAAVKDETSEPAPPVEAKVESLFEAPPKVLPGLKAEPKEQLTDDPVLVEIERRENGEIVQEPPLLASFDQPPPKRRGWRVAMLLLLLSGGGLYAAWMYEPGFREVTQPQISRLMAMAGLAQPASARPQPAVSASAPLQSTPAPTVAGATPSATSAEPAAGNNASATPGSPDASGTESPAAANVTNPAAPAGTGPSAATDSKAAAPVADASAGESSVEKNTVVLSSKGAEKRLIHQVYPAYPAAARAAGLEGTVVLKTFVDDRGRVKSVSLVEGNPILAESATRAVKQWRYRPYARDGQTLPFQTIVIVDFQRP